MREIVEALVQKRRYGNTPITNPDPENRLGGTIASQDKFSEVGPAIDPYEPLSPDPIERQAQVARRLRATMNDIRLTNKPGPKSTYIEKGKPTIVRADKELNTAQGAQAEMELMGALPTPPGMNQEVGSGTDPSTDPITDDLADKTPWPQVYLDPVTMDPENPTEPVDADTSGLAKTKPKSKAEVQEEIDFDAHFIMKFGR